MVICDWSDKSSPIVNADDFRKPLWSLIGQHCSREHLSWQGASQFALVVVILSTLLVDHKLGPKSIPKVENILRQDNWIRCVLNLSWFLLNVYFFRWNTCCRRCVLLFVKFVLKPSQAGFLGSRRGEIAHELSGDHSPRESEGGLIEILGMKMWNQLLLVYPSLTLRRCWFIWTLIVSRWAWNRSLQLARRENWNRPPESGCKRGDRGS